MDSHLRWAASQNKDGESDRAPGVAHKEKSWDESQATGSQSWRPAAAAIVSHPLPGPCVLERNVEPGRCEAWLASPKNSTEHAPSRSSVVPLLHPKTAQVWALESHFCRGVLIEKMPSFSSVGTIRDIHLRKNQHFKAERTQQRRGRMKTKPSSL